MCDGTILNTHATSDDKSHDDTRTVLRCQINSLHYYSTADIFKPVDGNGSLHEINNDNRKRVGNCDTKNM